jgi:hypothetical protein
VPSRGNTPQPMASSEAGSLIDLGEGTSATIPLQSTGYGGQGYQGQVATQNGWGDQMSSGISFQQPPQPYTSQHPSYPSHQSQFSQQQQFGGYAPPHGQYPPQLAFQQPQHVMHQQPFLPVPQHQHQYGQMPSASPYGQTGYSGQLSPGFTGMTQGNANWQGNSVMGGMNGMGMGTVYGQGMR